MGTTSKVISVILRLTEFVSSIIVTALFGRYLYLLDLANAGAGSRIVYTEVIAGLSIAFSLLLIVPAKYSFYAFPLDFVLSILWIVAFALLCNRTGTHTCSSYWYWDSWGWYWGGYWRITPRPIVTPDLIGLAGCSEWRCALAFSFIGTMCWLANSVLGLYVFTTYRESYPAVDPTVGPSEKRRRFWEKDRHHSHNPALGSVSQDAGTAVP